jgi:hypothetical protein
MRSGRAISLPAAVAATILTTALAALLLPATNATLTAAPGDGAHSFSAGASYRIYPSAVTQSEPFIARHPQNDSVLFVAANTIDLSTGFISEGVYASVDRGVTWSGSDTCGGAPIGFHRGDPGVAVDRNGTFVLTRLGFSPGLYSHYSTDRGATWSAQKQIASNDQDRADLATDGDPSSPRFGTSYAAWVRFSPPFPVLFSSTTDGGATWKAPVQVNSPTQRSQGADIEVGPGGVIYLCWAGVAPTSPFTEDFVGFARSTDGGAAWTVSENAFDINGIQGTLPQKAGIRVNGLPRLAVDGRGAGDPRLYIVTTEKNLAPAGSDPDVILRYSADSGATWSAGIRVNRDAPDNGKIQYFPAVHVDDRGGLDVLYYSDEPTTADSAAIFLARSSDAGVTWDAGEIGGHRFLPRPIGGLGAGYQGDNIALTSTGDSLRPVWTDNSTGVYQLWTCAVSIPPGFQSAGDPPALPQGYVLGQNYPNPFNPSTSISFTLLRAEFVTLTVHDLAGRTVGTLVSSRLPAGDHTMEFVTEGKGLVSGVYFYRLSAGGYVDTRKMVLIR